MCLTRRSAANKLGSLYNFDEVSWNFHQASLECFLIQREHHININILIHLRHLIIVSLKMIGGNWLMQLQYNVLIELFEQKLCTRTFIDTYLLQLPLNQLSHCVIVFRINIIEWFLSRYIIIFLQVKVRPLVSKQAKTPPNCGLCITYMGVKIMKRTDSTAQQYQRLQTQLLKGYLLLFWFCWETSW